MNLFRWLVLCCLWVGPAFTQPLSGIPAAFVDVGFGARPVAMGSAYVGLSDDVHSVLWNPAGLSSLPDAEVAFSSVQQLGLVGYQHMAAATPLQGGGQGMGVALIASGDAALRELTLHTAYARTFGALALGLGVKYRRASFGGNDLREEDYTVFDSDEIAAARAAQVQGTGQGFGLDLGLLYRPNPKAQVGVMLRDVVAPLNWDSRSNDPDRPARGAYREGVPMELAVGTVYRVGANLAVTADYLPSLQGGVSNRVRAGVEAAFLELFALRLGMQQQVNGLQDEQYALGFGLNTPPFQGLQVRASYTYLVQDLANSQHLSIALRF